MRITKIKFSSLATIFMVLAMVVSSCSKESIVPEDATSNQYAAPQTSVQGCWVGGASQPILSWYPDMVGALNNCYPEDPDPCAILGNFTTTKTFSGYSYPNNVQDKNFINGLLDLFKSRAVSNKPQPQRNDPAGTSWIIQSIDLNLSVSGGNPLQLSFTLEVTYLRVTCPLQQLPF